MFKITMLEKTRATRTARAAQISQLVKDKRAAKLENAKLKEKVAKAKEEVSATKRQLADTQKSLRKAEEKVEMMLKIEQKMFVGTMEKFSKQCIGLVREADEKTVWFRRRVEELEQQQVAGEPTARPSCSAGHCEVCWTDFSENPDRVPRVLECGHSLCTGCSNTLFNGDNIRCPFCRKVTEFKMWQVILPKNFTLLKMMRPDDK